MSPSLRFLNRAVSAAAFGVVLIASSAFAAPNPMPAAQGGLQDTLSCPTVQKQFDADRNKMELLMASLSSEDDKADTPARFRRMCALDHSISQAANRLGRLIAKSGKACLSPDDRAQAAQMRHLASPIPECAASGLSAKPKARPVGKSARKSPVVTTQAISPRQKPTSVPIMGLMGDLY